VTDYIADVSEFQGVIDWPTYGAQNSGVIVRAHNGRRADYLWAQNRDGARAHTSWRAFYQYLPAAIDPAAAARAFAATVGPLRPGEVLILDLEEGIGDQTGRRQAWYNALPGLPLWTYSGLSFSRTNLPGVFVEWIAAYGQSEPSTGHTLWQFTDAHAFAGINRPCDASVLSGDMTVNHLIGIGGSLADVPTITPPTPLTEDDMFSDTDRALLQNVENLLARDGDGGIRGDVQGTLADVGTVANELRALRTVTDAINARDPGAIAAAIPTDIARQVADLLAQRLAG